jgi:endogenous inhibitor of DNA gyrase (YacG/DUF329 family)
MTVSQQTLDRQYYLAKSSDPAWRPFCPQRSCNTKIFKVYMLKVPLGFECPRCGHKRKRDMTVYTKSIFKKQEKHVKQSTESK